MSSCIVCSNLQPESLTKLSKGQRAIIFVNLGDIKASTLTPRPCPECCLIWNALSLFKQDWQGTNYNKFVELVIALGKPIRLNWHDDSIQLELFSGYRVSDRTEANTSDLEVIGPANHVSEHSGADKCFQLASSWLERCRNSHPLCLPCTPSHLPTRVLDVGSPPGHDLRLLETNGRLGQYITLSYCWGDEQHQSLRTTAQTLEKNKVGIEFNDLSKTLQDAVILTRHLGVQYLWVDALCIIQGDANDWAAESSKMSQIYLNAILTISADNSSACNQGIFNKQTYGLPAQQIPYKGGKSVSVRKAFAQEHDRYLLGIRAAKSPEPTLCRAWTLQEATLSNKMLRYTTQELVWECNESWYCECGAASGTKGIDDYDERYLRNTSTSAVLPIDRVHEHWEQIVMRATERSLTDERDKLPALSGLATQFAEILQQVSASKERDVYLAGLWRSNLVKALQWAVEDDQYRTSREENLLWQRPKQWRAPSWSWAAVEGPVNYYPMLKLTSCLEILEASTTPSTMDVHGQVSTGKLVVRGRILSGLSLQILKPQPADPHVGFSNGKRYAISYHGGLRTFSPDDPNDFTNCSVGVNNISLTCLLLGHIATQDRGSWAGQEEVFLILRSCSAPVTGIQSKGEKVFERVGVSIRAFKERQMSTWNKERETRTAVGEVLRLFDAATEEVITII